MFPTAPEPGPGPTVDACADGCCGPTGSAAASAPRMSADRRDVLNRRVRLLVAATITYNVIEAAVALTAGTVASSAALIGFGLDSIVEVASAAAVAWQFSGRDPEARERAALRVIGLSFFALAGYVTVDSIRALVGATEAAPSPIGIVLAALSLLVMPFLSHAQRRAGRELGSVSAVADSKQTLLCTYLSAVLLVGLVLNSTLRLVLGRPDRRPGHRRRRGPGRARGLARRSTAADPGRRCAVRWVPSAGLEPAT